MSTIQIAHSPDLQKLREKGYNVQITDTGNLVVRDVPYVNGRREVIYDGVLGSNLELAGDVTAPNPKDHTVRFVGEYPCDSAGKKLTILEHGSGAYPLGSRLVAQQSFSRKPEGGYKDYFDKMSAYVALLLKHALVIDPDATARTGRVVEPEDDNSPFNYLDTASSRAEINEITAKLADEAVAIVGVGGTGSYVLDLIAKTPIKAIHLFDADRFLTHNAFRAPSAPAIEELRQQPLKVDHFKQIYSHMHRGIYSHPVFVDQANVDELKEMSFVFLCMDGGPAKRIIIEKLEEFRIPFADVGIGLTVVNNRIRGTLRSVLSLPDNRDRMRNRISCVEDDAANEYDKNVQVADLNALNACLAVISWKKLRGFYVDQGRERFITYTVASSRLNKAEIAV